VGSNPTPSAKRSQSFAFVSAHSFAAVVESSGEHRTRPGLQIVIHTPGGEQRIVSGPQRPALANPQHSNRLTNSAHSNHVRGHAPYPAYRPGRLHSQLLPALPRAGSLFGLEARG